jgi:hypothetical protein
MMPRIAMGAAALAVVLAAAQDATAQDAKAVEAYQGGVDLAKQGKYAEAIEMFEEAMKLGAPSMALYNIARCYESMGKLDLAVDYYRRYIQAPDAEDVVGVEAKIEELESKPSAVTVTSEPEGAKVHEILGDGTTLELGETPLEFGAKAGEHTYLVSADGFMPTKVKIETGMGKPYPIHVELVAKGQEDGGGGGGREEPAQYPSLGLFFELGGGVAMHAYRHPGFKVGGDVGLGLGWRFAHGAASGFAVGLRTTFRPYTLVTSSGLDDYQALFVSILAVPAYQIGLHERVGLEITVPVGIAVLRPTKDIPPWTRVDVVGGSIEGGGLALVDVGAGACIRVMLFSGLYLAVEPVRIHVLVPTSKWENGTKALVDLDVTVRMGFEL